MLLKIVSRKYSRKKQRSRNKLGFWISVVAAASLWFGYKQVEGIVARPEAILVLGGDEERESFAAQLARDYPDLPIWVSGGSPEDYAYRIFTNAGIDRDRIHLDYQAVDTVTNFTTLVDEFKAQGIDSVYLVTSDSHMRRARVIGEIVFGSRGIILKPVEVPSNHEPESLPKALRDGARAVLWLTTGDTGEGWLEFLAENALGD